MRVKLDENLPDSVLSILGGAGHDVDTARAEGLRGAKDPAVWVTSGPTRQAPTP